MMFTANKIEPKCNRCKGSGQTFSGGGVDNPNMYGCRVDICALCGGSGKRGESLIPACDPILREALQEFKDRFG